MDLQSYYSWVTALNYWSENIAKFDVPRDFEGYVRSLSFAVDLGSELCMDIVGDSKGSLKLRKGKGDPFSQIVDDKERDKFLAALYYTRMTELQEVVETGEWPKRYFAPASPLAKAEPSAFRSWILAVEAVARQEGLQF